MTITIDGNGNITNSGGYTGDGVSFADATPANTLVTTTGGNVGIGTSAPGYKLDISGSDDVTRLTSSTTSSGMLMADSGGTIRVGTRSGAAIFDTGGSERMRIDSAGNVGIGTSSPAGKLHTQLATSFSWGGGWNSGVAVFGGGSSASGALAVSYNDTDGAIIGSIAPGVAWKPVKFYSDSLIFATNGASERMRITAAGNVLIGTSSLAAANWVNEIKNTTTDAWPLALNGTTRGMVIRNSSATSGFYAYFEYNGGTNNGSIAWSGGTTGFNTTSDARIKENIIDSPEAGSLIDTIRVRSWDFKADGAHWRYGMIAQELIEIVPEAVHAPEDPDIMMGVDYSKLVPMLVKEIQSLRARLAAVEGVIQ